MVACWTFNNDCDFFDNLWISIRLKKPEDTFKHILDIAFTYASLAGIPFPRVTYASDQLRKDLLDSQLFPPLRVR